MDFSVPHGGRLTCIEASFGAMRARAIIGFDR